MTCSSFFFSCASITRSIHQYWVFEVFQVILSWLAGRTAVRSHVVDRFVLPLFRVFESPSPMLSSFTIHTQANTAAPARQCATQLIFVSLSVMSTWSLYRVHTTRHRDGGTLGTFARGWPAVVCPSPSCPVKSCRGLFCSPPSIR